MWRESLQVWKLSLTANPFLTGLIFALLSTLSLLALIPFFAFLSAFLNYYLSFAFIVYVSKTYIREGQEGLRDSLKTNLIKVFSSYTGETLAVILGQVVLMVTTALLGLFMVIFVGSFWFLIKPFLEGEEVSWAGLLLSISVAVFIYLSTITSFPVFFGRAMLRGRGFGNTLRFFLSSLYAEISWKTILNWDYIKSSFVISLITPAFIIAGVFLAPLFPIIVFSTLHLAYIFGTVACFKLLRS